jgi:teichuronic acid biosynthesis glycosyltransferase TuaC
MKVLFLSSGNKHKGISPIVKRQAMSLERKNICLDYYSLSGKGFLGYLRNIMPLRNYCRSSLPDIIHAHYSLSAFLAVFSGKRPLIVSLMGSEAYSSFFNKLFIRICNLLFWKEVIVKSLEMKKLLRLKKASVIPNGVDTEKFSPMDNLSCIRQLNWKEDKIHILFAGNPLLREKNFSMVQEALNKYDFANTELHVLENVNPDEVVIWMNAAHVIILTSLREGSPNVIKEAMACNRPVVATNAGDIKWLLGEEAGHFLCDFSVDDLIAKLLLAIRFSLEQKQTTGRTRILKLGLTDSVIAEKIIQVYLKAHPRFS